jgi:hypothetical protein
VGGHDRAARCASDLPAFVRRTTARKVTATITTVAAWAFVVGLGTFGRFENGHAAADLGTVTSTAVQG